jgi:hypothetical protein
MIAIAYKVVGIVKSVVRTIPSGLAVHVSTPVPFVQRHCAGLDLFGCVLSGRIILTLRVGFEVFPTGKSISLSSLFRRRAFRSLKTWGRGASQLAARWMGTASSNWAKPPIP